MEEPLNVLPSRPVETDPNDGNNSEYDGNNNENDGNNSEYNENSNENDGYTSDGCSCCLGRHTHNTHTHAHTQT
jgi:hypothetical protein